MIIAIILAVIGLACLIPALTCTPADKRMLHWSVAAMIFELAALLLLAGSA
jgi:hypothetical protein